MRRTLLALPVLALSAPMLAGCGEDEASAAEVIRSSPEALAEAGTAHVSMTIDAGAGEPIEAEGDFDLEGETGTMTMQLPAPVDTAVEVIFDGTAYYLGTDALGPIADQVEADWIHFDLETLAEISGVDVGALPAGGGTTSPTSALDGLEGITEDGVEDLGTEDVGGVSTHHYAAEIDMAAALEQANEQTGGDLIDEEAAEQFLETFGDEPAPVEVWIDDEGLTRRMTMEFGAADGEDPVSMELEMSDFGEPVDIDIPDESETVDFLDALGGFLPDN